MELDEYKMVSRQQPDKIFHKGIPQLDHYLRQQTESLMDIITKDLKLEIFFALLFLLFDCYVLLFVAHNYLRVLTLLLLAFCVYFIYYLVMLLRSIQFQHIILSSVKHLLECYVSIIQKFTRLYFQLTMVIIPLIFLLAFICAYLDYRALPFRLNNSFSLQNIWIYLGIAAAWCFLMYFFYKMVYQKVIRKASTQIKGSAEGTAG